MSFYNEIRKACSRSLDGMWFFKADYDRKGEEERWHEQFPADAEPMAVPSCWNNTPRYFDHEGVGYYKTEFFSRKGNVRFVFEGVSNTASVWLDGHLAAEHVGAYTAFSFRTNFPEDGMHTLVVRADATVDDKTTVPNRRRDWKRYGGIIRDVCFLNLPDSYADDLQVSYTLSEDLKQADVTLQVDYRGYGAQEYILSVNDRVLSTVQLTPGENTLSCSLPEIRLWNVGDPYLYTFTLCRADGEDAVSVRTGLRLVTVENRRICVNHIPVYLRGINRHEDHPDWGHSLPLKLMLRDLQIIRDLGCNMIRGSHYPNCQDFLDLCDENGILFWEELPLWFYREHHANNPLVVQTILHMGEEMVRQNLHHPCIFVWGLHNECETNTDAFVALSRQMADLYRNLDPSRLITYATDHMLTDKCYPVCDFISINNYPGWYGPTVDGWHHFFEEFDAYLAALGQDSKPIVISEFGAGAIAGQHSFEMRKWSEEYQSYLLERSMEIFLQKPAVAGMIVWQFCDIRVSTDEALNRPRSFNNKGLIDEYRNPKSGFFTVQRIYRDMARKHRKD